MNVYVLETAARLVRRGVAVDIFTRSERGAVFSYTGSERTVELESGVRVHSLAAGALGATLMDAREDFDLIHSHYWLSGQIGLVVRERRRIPLVHSMHTMARVKNLNLAAGDRAEPPTRVAAEAEIVRLADRLVANTAQERDELVALYGARPTHVEVVHPGVSRDLFSPRNAATAGGRAPLRHRLGIGTDERIVLFAGRLQPHKGPDIAIEALAHLAKDVRLVIVGGPSGSGLEHPTALGDLAGRLGVADRVTFVPPIGQAGLADWYLAADVVCVPSHSESFGLVALEAQACGAPVVAAAVGGLTTAVVDGVTGILVRGHDPVDYARALGMVLDDGELRTTMGTKAAVHATEFTWDATVDRLLDAYERAVRGE